MNTEDDSLIFLGFRFVPYDQWLVTHLDTSWKIKQAKHWLLSKCNLSGPSQTGMPATELDLPRYRAISPITFASGAAYSRSSIDNGNGGSDGDGEPSADTGDAGDDEEEDQSDGLSSNGSFEYSYGDNGKRPKHGPSARGGSHTIRLSISASDFRAPTPSECKNISSRYVLVAFSTGQILEDDFPVSWYNLRPYELLEMHMAGAVVSLPREIKAEYVQPYFECKVKCLRIVWGERLRNETSSMSSGKVRIKVRRKRSGSQTTSGNQSKSLNTEEEVTSSKDSSKKEKKRRRTKFEWRERWVVVHQGMLNVCRHRTDQTPTHSYSLSSLIEIRGAEHLFSCTSPPISGAADPRIVCAKFTLPWAATSGTPQSMPSSPVDGVHQSTGGIGEGAKGRNAEEKPAEWTVFDMLEDNAFTSFLRVLHRHSPHTTSSSFLPSSFVHTTYRASSNSPPLTPTPSPSTPTLYSKELDTFGSILAHTPTQLGIVPYPEWRLEMVDKAHNAGMGDLGLAMQVALLGVSAGPAIEDISSEEDISDVEWEGWMRDLSRQRRLHRQKAHKETAPAVVSSPLSSSPESESQYVVRSLVSTISPTFSPSSSSDHFVTHHHHHPPAIVKKSQPPVTASGGSWGNSRGLITPTITSTVTVGNPVKSTKSTRKRSSTVTAAPVGSKLLKKRETTGTSKSNLTVATSPIADSFEDYELVPPITPAASADLHPRRTSILRHVRSGSNLHRKREESEPPLPVSAPAQEEGSSTNGTSQKKRRGLVKGVSLQAEKFAKGLDSALDFVDGRVGFGTL